MGGGGHPDPEMGVGGGLQKIFSALWASVWSQNKEGGPGPAGPSTRSATAIPDSFCATTKIIQDRAPVNTKERCGVAKKLRGADL